MELWVLSFTRRGGSLSGRLAETLRKEGGYSVRQFSKGRSEAGARLDLDLESFALRAFGECQALVFIGAAAIAVRSIAAALRSKDRDPAVLVLDEAGKYVIPLLSGHLGGANRLAEAIAGYLGSAAVVTTATDVNARFAVDVWAADNGCAIQELDLAKAVSSAILDGGIVGISSDFPLEGELPGGLARAEGGALGIRISLDPGPGPFARTLHLVPRCLTLGLGCRKGVRPEELELRVRAALDAAGLPLCAVAAAATIDLKASEPALTAFCEKHGLPLRILSARELAEIPGDFSASDFVRTVAGVDNVCERAAVGASGGAAGAELVMRKAAGGGVTVAAARSRWRGLF